MDKKSLLYKRMFRRQFEEKISKLYAEGRTMGLVHTYVGEEEKEDGICL